MNINVIELDETLTPIYINSNHTETQIDLLLYENHHCPMPKLQTFMNKTPHMKHVCRRCIRAFSTNDALLDHIERCIKQKPANIAFSWKHKSIFDYFYMKIDILFRVYADFESFNQPVNDSDEPNMQSNFLFEQILTAV